MPKKEMSYFGKRLYEIQVKKGLNSGALAKMLGVVPQRITYLKTSTPRPQKIKEIADILKVEPSIFIENKLE